jgi:hypothetical protein
MMVMGLSSHAQDSNNPWALGFAIDTRTSAGNCVVSLTNIFLNLLLLKITGIYFHQYLILVYLPRRKLLFGVQGSVNKISNCNI